MLKHVTFVLFLAISVRGNGGFVFPDEVSGKSSKGSWYGEGGHDNSDSYDFDDEWDSTNYDNYGSDGSSNYDFGKPGNFHGKPQSHELGAGNRPYNQGHSLHSDYNGNHHNNNNNGGFVPGFGNHGYDKQPSRPGRPGHGNIVSQSQAHGHSTGSGSLANAQSGSQFFNEGSQSNAQAQAQSQGYQQGFGSNGASSASSAASATSGIVNGVPVASASASAAAASSGGGGSSSVSSASSSSSGNSGGSGIQPWYFRSRISGDNSESKDNDNGETSQSGSNDSIIFSDK